MESNIYILKISYDLQFWNLQQGTVLNKGATTLRDEKWLTWSATLGWPV